MANPQLENGHTRVANEIIEHIIKEKLNGTQFRILLILWRYTYGFHRKKHRLSLTFIAEAIGGDKRQIQRDLKVLADRRIIFHTIERQERVIGFNKDYDEWTDEMNKIENQEPDLFSSIGENAIGESTNGENTNSTIGESTTPPLVNLPIAPLVNLPTKKERKKTIKKQLKKKKKSSLPKGKVPDFIDECLDVWKDEYKKHRQNDYEFVNKGKDREGIGKLVGIIKKKHKESSGGSPPIEREELLKRIRATFSVVLKIEDNYFKNNLTPMLLVAKFNEIKNILKNGNGKTGSKITDEYLKRIIEEELNVS
jgi:phage replication O-like protein O